MPDNIYQKQAELLLRVLPLVMREDVFALKGVRQLISSGGLSTSKNRIDFAFKKYILIMCAILNNYYYICTV